jgi:hypothetical protein
MYKSESAKSESDNKRFQDRLRMLIRPVHEQIINVFNHKIIVKCRRHEIGNQLFKKQNFLKQTNYRSGWHG